MQNKKEVPFISALIVTYNEERYIYKCLNSLLNQTYPKDRYEIIIIDGYSSDRTLDEINRCIREHNKLGDKTPKIHFYNNPKRNLASGWNLGINKSKGDYVVRIDGHAYASSNFLEENVKTLHKVGDVFCVGGSMNTVTDTKIGNSIVKVLSTPFGVGGARFRYQKEPGYVDTVAYGMYKKNIFKMVGLFDEELERTQDNDLHRRIREIGGKFYLNPSIETYYYSRNNIKDFLKQAFQNGKWTMINFRRRPGAMAVRHFIPFFFVTFIIASIIFSVVLPKIFTIFLFVMLIYSLIALFYSCKVSMSVSEFLLIPFLYFGLHIFYGLGSITGICTQVK